MGFTNVMKSDRKVAEEADEALKAMEERVRAQVNIIKKTRRKLEKERHRLFLLVSGYHEQRTSFQQSIWRNRGLGWCFGCIRLCPAPLILLYTDGHDAYEKFEDKSIKSYCSKCAEGLLNCSGGEENKFQCYKAKIDDGTISIFINGEWTYPFRPEEIKVKIERPWIPESEYEVGVDISPGG